MNTTPRHETIVDLVRERVVTSPHRTVFRYLRDGQTEQQSLTLADLDLRARCVAARLQSTFAFGSRIVLLFPSGLDHICAFLGCLYAGMIPVPSFAPSGGRNLDRLRSIVADCGPAAVLTTNVGALSRAASRIAGIEPEFIDVSSIGTADAAGWNAPRVSPESIALLQYTSGSTSTPKGIVVTHANLLANERMIASAFGQDAESVIVGWLPFHHDMGLIGNLLQPLFTGACSILMSPNAFLRRPSVWLEAISRYRATTSGGPNFAYQLCVDKIRPSQAEALDLSSWSVAFSGAEPISAQTIEQFSGAFAQCGFRREAFQPCYGLAEATLFVCGARLRSSAALLAVDAGALRNNHVRPVEPGRADGGVLTLVGCGAPVAPGSVAIVDPTTGRRSAPAVVGEIWVAGPHVASGYTGAATECEVFQARIAGEDGPAYLRTGDLGFCAGELFVTGRLKDLIIIRGENHYPADIEYTISRSAPEFASRQAAVFTLENDDRIAAAQELGRNSARDLPTLAALAREAVAREHSLRLDTIAFVNQGGVPRTSSGKVQRSLCKQEFLGGALDCIAVFRLDGGPAGDDEAAPSEELGSPADVAYIERQLVPHIARCVGIKPADVNPNVTLDSLGVDSLARAEIQAMLAERCGVALGPSDLFGELTVRELADRVVALAGQPQPGQPARDVRSDAPLSPEQDRLWVLTKIRGATSDLNLSAAIRIRGKLNITRLEEAVRALVSRHEALRTVFRQGPSGPVRCVLPPEEAGIGIERAPSGATQGEAELWATLRSENRRVLDVVAGPVIRARLISVAERDHLLTISIHHMAADAWSFGVLVRDLAALYDPAAIGFALPELPRGFPELNTQDTSALPDSVENDLRYWAGRFEGGCEMPTLPFTSSEASADLPDSDRLLFTIPADVLKQLEDLAGRTGVTLFAGIFTAFNLALGDWTGRGDLVTAVPVLGRYSPGSHHAVGLFAKPVLMRTERPANGTLRDMLLDVQREVRAAAAHQQVPFLLMLESAGVKRTSRSPLRIPVLFSMLPPFEPAHTTDGVEFAIEALDGGNQEVDLLVAVGQSPQGGLAGQILFDPRRMEPVRVNELKDAFLGYLERLASSPDSSVPLLSGVGQHAPYQIAVAATFSAEPLADSLRFWAEQLGAEFAVSFAPFGQVLQELLRADGLLASNGSGANLILIRLSDWFCDNEPFSRKADDLLRGLETSAQRTRLPHVVCFVPSEDCASNSTRFPDWEQHIAARLSGIPGVRVLTSTQILEQYPVEDYRDAEADALACIPFTSTFFAALGTAIVRVLYALHAPRPKVIAVDCDQTLWTGVCGEDGPNGIGIEPHRRWLQEFLVRQHEEGTLLALCSKNNEHDITSVFALRGEEMPLKRRHIAREALNWKSKADNLQDIAESLGLALESFVFIDDNPAACAEVRAHCPEVLVLELPADPQQSPQFLSHVWAFDSRSVSLEDARRTEYYRIEERRRQSCAAAPSMLEFLRGLDLRLQIFEPGAPDLLRASQLAFRTNQFTTTAARWSEAELAAWSRTPGQGALVVRASDRFGDYGLVSLVLYRICPPSVLWIESWALSCRALGRGVEERVVAHLGTLAAERTLHELAFRFRDTGSNVPAAEFLRSIASEQAAAGGETSFVCSAASAAGCVEEIERRWAVATPRSFSGALRRRQTPAPAGAVFHADLPRIARELCGASQVLAAMRGAAPQRVSQGPPPQSPTEEAVAAIWSELLAVSSPSRNDDFFESGGDSVLSMRMLAEIRRRFSVDLPLAEFFTRDPTIAEIAAAIEHTLEQQGVNSECAAQDS